MVFCSYCVQTEVIALKTCLHCEASLCEEHLKIHSKSTDHVLIEPTASVQDWKCSTHHKLIEFYCNKDGAYICVSCCIIGDHRGHAMDPLKDALEKRKAALKEMVDNLNSAGEESEKRLENLQRKKREVQEKAAGVTERVAALFSAIRERLDELEKQAFGEISRQEERSTLPVTVLTRQLEIRKEELSKKTNLMEELRNIKDPLAALKKSFNVEEKPTGSRKNSRRDREANLTCCLNEVPVSLVLHVGLQSLAGQLLPLKAEQHFPELEPSDVSLDVKTAHKKIIVSGDLKSATYSAVSQKYPDGPERFKARQVLNTSAFTSGRHYYEVDVSEAASWIIGVAYQSIERKGAGNKSFIGYNDKSWGLFFQNYLGISHNNIQQAVVSGSPVRTVGVFLDYEAGQLSFYQLGEQMLHLHTFTATFTEPLYAAFYIFDNSRIRIRH
ncbi:E3 ubiquitin-protein ligase TRIM39-like [Spea bombifrons]|uniref:E3 ubiquitin-protein ligase TRIM39-like n=1 Tax=Spea bombifrons TaxID=233779 RepID=UPI00234A383A|nr:E3 ubiquitin-protein ligase TRIM39-like [Spea bombifrons]